MSKEIIYKLACNLCNCYTDSAFIASIDQDAIHTIFHDLGDEPEKYDKHICSECIEKIKRTY